MTEANIVIEDAQITGKIVKIARIVGQLDESNVDEKIQEIYKLIEVNPKGLNLIFDLANLEYMNSKSIGYLTDLYGKITESGGQVVIAQPKPNIEDILQVVGLTQLIHNFASLDEAKKFLSTETVAIATPVAEAVAAPVATTTTAPAPAPAPTPAPTPTTPPVQV